MEALVVLSVSLAIIGLSWAFAIAYSMGSVNLHRAMAAWHLETADRLEDLHKTKAETVMGRLSKVRLG